MSLMLFVKRSIKILIL